MLATILMHGHASPGSVIFAVVILAVIVSLFADRPSTPK